MRPARLWLVKIYRTLKGGVVYEPVDPARATP
jgi:hypothetical protein